MGDQSTRKSRSVDSPRRVGGVKKWLLIALAAVVLLIAAIAIVGPIAASRIARTVIADAVNESIEGTIRVDSVRVGWAGPIGADGVSLRDPQGTEVATLTARTNRGILGLGMSLLGGGGIDLGTISLSGSAILERGPDGELTIAQAVAPRVVTPPTPQRPTGAPAPTRQPPTAAAPSAPRGLRGTLDITGIEIAIREAGRPVAGLRDFTGGGPFEIGQPISMSFNATPMTATTPIQLTIEGTDLFDAGGTLTLDQAELVLALSAAIPDAEIDAGVRALTGTATTPTSQPSNPPTTDATLDLALRLADGRLTLHENKPARLSAAVPVALAAAATTEAAGQFELQPGARIALVIDQLDIPTGGIASDWRGAALDATLTTDQLAGRFAIPEPGSPEAAQPAVTAPDWRAFALQTTPVRLTLDPGSSLLTVNAGATGTIDGESAGRFALDAEVGEALAADGTIASTLPGILRGELEVDGVRTDAPWFALIEQITGAPLRAALGEQATLTATASLPPVEERLGLVEVLASITLQSPRTQASIGFGVSSSGVRAHDGGVLIESSAAGPVLEALGIPLRDEAYTLDLARTRAIVRLPAFLVPIVDRGPNLEAASGDLTVELRDAQAVVVQYDMPVDMQLLRLTAGLRPGEPARADLLGTIAADGSPIGLRGGVTITTPGALLATDPDADALANIEQAGIAGELFLDGLPARLLSAIDADLAGLLEDALGDRLALALETSEWRAAPAAATPGTTNTAATGLITLIAEGPRGRLRGPIDLTLAEAPTIATRGDGLQLVLREPQRVIDRFPIEGITLGVEQPFVAYLVDVDAALPEAGPDLRSAKLELLLPMLRANIAPVDPKGQPSALALREPRVDVTITPDGWADLAIRAEQGEIDGRPLTIDGSLGVRGALARALDPAGFLASAAPIETRGQWSIAGLSASALRVIDPALVPLADAALPGPIRVEIAASRTGAAVDNDRPAEAPGFTLRVLGENQRQFATTRAALDGQQLIVGPTITTLPITADLVQRGLSFAELDPVAFPAPTSPFEVRASATTMRYPLDALADGQPFDPLQPNGPWEARLGTTPADITFRMPPGEGPAAGTSIGVRGLSAFRTVVPGDAAASRQGAAVSFFDPPATGTGPGTPFGSFTASSSVDDLSQINIEGTALRLGEIAQRFGLGDVPMLALGAGESRLNLTGGLTGTNNGAETNPAETDQRIEATASLAAPRLTLNGALRHDPATGSINILQPFELAWNLDRRLVEQFVLGHEPGNPADQSNIRLQRDIPVRGSVQTLDLVLADESVSRPMRIDRVAATLSTDPVTIVPRTGQPMELGGLRLDVRPEAQPGILGIALRSGITPGTTTTPTTTGPLNADGRIRLPVGEQPGQLTLTARGDLPSLALDALARSGQTLTAVLGERATFNLSVNQLTTDFTAGRIAADMNSPNATVRLQGNARDGLLELTSTSPETGGPSEARLSVISPEASRILFEPLFPIFSNIEKSTGQRPTLLSVERMALPIDGDLTKLSGRFTLDLGEISFATPPIVGSILSATGNRADGTIGTRLQPLIVTIDQGVASYEPWAIPIGEFTLQMSGKVNLAAQRVDEVMIYVPIGALARELSDQFTRIPLIGQGGMAAFRLSGPVGNLQIQPVLDPAALLGIPGVRQGGQQDGTGNPLLDIIGGGIRQSGRVDEETVDQVNDVLRNLRRRDRRTPREEEQPNP